MECPKCKSTYVEVIDTRPAENNSIRRRRICRDCSHRFTTYELTVQEIIDNNNQIRDSLRKNLDATADKIFSRPITTLERYCKTRTKGLKK